MVETNPVDNIGPRLQPQLQQVGETEGLRWLGVLDTATEHDSPLSLIELVAPNRIVEEVAEVGKQAQVGVDPEELHVLHRVASEVTPSTREAVALGVAAVGPVDLAEPVDQTTGDRSQRESDRWHPTGCDNAIPSTENCDEPRSQE